MLTDIVDVLAPLGTALLPVVVAGGTGLILRAMKAKGMNTMYFETVVRAGGVAFAALKASGQPMSNKVAMRAAAVAGAQYLAARLPEYLANQGLKVEAQVDIVHAQLGTLVAQATPPVTVAATKDAPITVYPQSPGGTSLGYQSGS